MHLEAWFAVLQITGSNKKEYAEKGPCHMNDLSGLFARLEAHSKGGLASTKIYPASLDACLRPKASAPIPQSSACR